MGAPELFLLRSLLFSVDNMGCPPWLVGKAELLPMCEDARDTCLGLLELTVGLKVTVRCGLGAFGLGAPRSWANEEISGVVSFELDAMMGDLLV
jgi:hypothetical protein